MSTFKSKDAAISRYARFRLNSGCVKIAFWLAKNDALPEGLTQWKLVQKSVITASTVSLVRAVRA